LKDPASTEQIQGRRHLRMLTSYPLDQDLPAKQAAAPNPVADPEVIAAMTARQQRLCQPPYIGGRTPSFDSRPQ
jgi:hypothetical protein